MGTEDDNAVVGHLVQLVDEHGAPLPQVLHHELVVHHLVAHVDRRTEHVQRAVDDIDCAVHPGAKAPGIGQVYIH